MAASEALHIRALHGSSLVDDVPTIYRAYYFEGKLNSVLPSRRHRLHVQGGVESGKPTRNSAIHVHIRDGLRLNA